MTIETRTCEVRPAALKAALLFAAKDAGETRGYLKGVCVEHVADHVRLIATDGHRLLCVKVGPDAALGAANRYRYVIPRDVIASALKLHAKAPLIAIKWERETVPDPERPGVTIVRCARVDVGGIVTTDVQDASGPFPDYERIVPRETSGKLAHFNTEYLNDCSKAKALLGARGVPGFIEVFHNGDSAGVVDIDSDAFAVVMPMRGSGATFALPEWFAGAGDSAKERAA